MSMLRQAAQDQRKQRLILLYSNPRLEDAAFLQQLEEKNPTFRLVATMTEMHASSRPWAGQTGLMTAELVARVVGDLAADLLRRRASRHGRSHAPDLESRGDR